MFFYLSKWQGMLIEKKEAKVILSRQLSSIVHPLFPKLHAIRDTLDDDDDDDDDDDAGYGI